MFTIIHKKPKIVLDAFTDRASLYDLFQIERATKHIPDWFKNLSMSVEGDKDGFRVPRPTMKGCVAITDTFKESFIVPNWQDVYLRVVDGQFDWATPESKELQGHITQFGAFQKGGPFKQVGHCKIDTPWLIKEKTGAKFLLGDTFWNNYDHHKRFHYKVVPGLIQYKTQGSLNVNIVAKYNTPDFTIKVGEPLAQLYPMTDSRVEIRHHLIDPLEYHRIQEQFAFYHSFTGRFRTVERMLSWKNKK